MTHQNPPEAKLPAVTITPSEVMQGYLEGGAILTPDPEALVMLAERLKTPLPPAPNIRLLHEKDPVDWLRIESSRKVYDPASPDLYVALPKRYLVEDEGVLLEGTALALMNRKRAMQRRRAGRAGGSLAAAGLAVSAVGSAFDFNGHGWGSVVEKVGFGVFAVGGSWITYAYNRGEPVVPDLSGLTSPIQVR